MNYKKMKMDFKKCLVLLETGFSIFIKEDSLRK